MQTTVHPGGNGGKSAAGAVDAGEAGPETGAVDAAFAAGRPAGKDGRNDGVDAGAGLGVPVLPELAGSGGRNDGGVTGDRPAGWTPASVAGDAPPDRMLLGSPAGMFGGAEFGPGPSGPAGAGNAGRCGSDEAFGGGMIGMGSGVSGPVAGRG